MRSRKRIKSNSKKRTIFLAGRGDVTAVNFTAVKAYIGSPPRREIPNSRVSTRLGLNKSEENSLKLDPAKQSLIEKIANRDLILT